MKNKFEIHGERTIIFITRRNKDIYECLIDTIDLEKAQEIIGTWCVLPDKTTGNIYVGATMNDENSRKRYALLHRWITGSPKGMIVDHINHNTLDNRRSVNLRVVTPSQSQQNRKGAQRNSKSGIRGVCWDNTEKRWIAQVCVSKNIIPIGRFIDINEAASAVREARAKLLPYSQESIS